MGRRRNEDIENTYYMKIVKKYIDSETEAARDLKTIYDLRDQHIPDEIAYMMNWFINHLFVYHPETMVHLYNIHEELIETRTDVTNIVEVTKHRFLSYYEKLEELGVTDGKQEKCL